MIPPISINAQSNPIAVTPIINHICLIIFFRAAALALIASICRLWAAFCLALASSHRCNKAGSWITNISCNDFSHWSRRCLMLSSFRSSWDDRLLITESFFSRSNESNASLNPYISSTAFAAPSPTSFNLLMAVLMVDKIAPAAATLSMIMVNLYGLRDM